MRRIFILLAVPVVFATTFFSCSKSGTDPSTNICDGVTNKTFATDVNPIIQTFCNQPSCHNPGSVNGPGALTNYAEVFNARGDIRAAVASGFMPKNATLTTAQRNAIICWIDSGAPNN